MLKYNTSTKSQQMHEMNCKYNGLNTVAYYVQVCYTCIVIACNYY